MAKYLAPNRVAVYVAALGALLTAVSGVIWELDWSSVVSIISSLAILCGVIVKWLGGWQQYEKIVMQSQLMQQEHERALEAQASAVQAVGKPGTGPRLNLPR